VRRIGWPLDQRPLSEPQVFDDLLCDQSRHVRRLLAEMQTERSLVCMRRLIECRLATDRFREAHLDVHEVPARSDVEWRETFLSDTAGAIFDNYDLRVRTLEKRTPICGEWALNTSGLRTRPLTMSSQKMTDTANLLSATRLSDSNRTSFWSTES
jgi:hypothetical protein